MRLKIAIFYLIAVSSCSGASILSRPPFVQTVETVIREAGLVLDAITKGALLGGNGG